LVLRAKHLVFDNSGLEFHALAQHFSSLAWIVPLTVGAFCAAMSVAATQLHHVVF
jgi:hypothetical protein